MALSPLKISAKNLGYTALESFCPRCYWIKLRMSHSLPWQSFPGIFSSIDAFTKHCVHQMIDSKLQPAWMKLIGDVVGYEKVPHWTANKHFDEKSGITLTGVPDDIWVLHNNAKILPDFKTAKFSNTQDKLLPMYEIQSNVYSVLIDKKAKLYLIYMEPDTDKTSAKSCTTITGFKMDFNAVVVPIENDLKKVRRALSLTREIFEMPKAPQSKEGCKECEKLDTIMGLL